MVVSGLVCWCRKCPIICGGLKVRLLLGWMFGGESALFGNWVGHRGECDSGCSGTDVAHESLWLSLLWLTSHSAYSAGSTAVAHTSSSLLRELLAMSLGPTAAAAHSSTCFL